MILGGFKSRRDYFPDLIAQAKSTGREIEVDSTAGLSIVKASSGIELVAPIGQVA